MEQDQAANHWRLKFSNYLEELESVFQVHTHNEESCIFDQAHFMIISCEVPRFLIAL